MQRGGGFLFVPRLLIFFFFFVDSGGKLRRRPRLLLVCPAHRSFQSKSKKSRCFYFVKEEKNSRLVFFPFFSLLDVHTKKVRKVPPGLPSSVSDNMPSLFLFFLDDWRWFFKRRCCFGWRWSFGAEPPRLWVGRFWRGWRCCCCCWRRSRAGR